MSSCSHLFNTLITFLNLSMFEAKRNLREKMENVVKEWTEAAAVFAPWTKHSVKTFNCAKSFVAPHLLTLGK